MSTDVSEIGVKFNAPDFAIATMANKFMPLEIRDANDVEGYKEVHEARMVVKNKRVEVEKVRKALKADALEYGRMVDAEAKRITALLEPIELHLQRQEDYYNAEKERIKNAARLKAEAEAKAKAEAEEAVRRAEQDRIRKEQEAESERLRIERQKIEVERREIEAEQKRLADIEAARLRAEEMERAKAEAFERAKRETEERIAREAAEAKAKAEREAAEKARIEAARPDGDKLRSVANEIASVVIPSMSTPDGDKAAMLVRKAINAAAEEIREIVNQMYAGRKA